MKKQIKKKKGKKGFIKCKCGSEIHGTSQTHARANMKNHKKSNKHKQYLKIKKELREEKKHEN